MFLATLFLPLAAAHLAWWWWARRALPGVGVRRLLALFAAVPLAALGFRLAGVHGPLPLAAVGWVWLLSALPVTLGAVALLSAAGWLRRWPPKRRAAEAEPATDPPRSAGRPRRAPVLTRRRFVAGLAAAPPVVAVVATGWGTTRLDRLRTARHTLHPPGLPPSLHGLTIAHVSDVHAGTFSHGPTLARIVDAVNALDADVVCFTGDLIDHHLADLPAAAEMMRAFRSRLGTFAVEGNHDLLAGRSAFRRGCDRHGVDLLVGEARRLDTPGGGVDLLGLPWVGGRDAALARAVGRLPAARPGAFPVLLAHHPHAFGPAAAAGLPLTLSGHTHGGQMMTPGGWGFGPVMFRHWSGPSLDPRTGRIVVVSNGAGHWFPVRIHAPAEVTLLTLAATPAPPPPRA